MGPVAPSYDNRTYVELKFATTDGGDVGVEDDNRTYVELKYETLQRYVHGGWMIIVLM